MLIRSQDKYAILNINLAYSVSVGEENNILYWHNKSHATILGTYSTEEQAIAVLDKICKCYENYQNTPQANAIYQMPDDDGRN